MFFKTFFIWGLFISIALTMSQVASAQLVPNTRPIIQQIDQVDDQVNKLRRRINTRLPEKNINNNLLPPIESLTTSPLNSLPDTLPIGSDILHPAYVEVKVENNWRAIKNQWMILADKSTKNKLVALGVSVESERDYAGLNLSIMRFTVPDNLDSKQALAAYLSASELSTLDRNHVYQAQAAQHLEPQNSENHQQAMPVNKTMSGSFCANKLRIGIIDSAIAQTHPVFKDVKISAKSFLKGEVKSPTQHGTAVASVLVGTFENKKPLLNNAHLFSAEVFYRQSDYAQGSTLNAIIEALNWLLEEKVQVINMSLAGPNNAILNAVITATLNKDAYIVAAAGNEGPAALPVYPAGFEGVIAVSAIDENQQAYRWSNQGEYIDYSALGVNVITAQSQNRVGRESGTSMAAPIVSAALACTLAKLSNTSAPNRQVVLTTLDQMAVDLGPKGKDKVFGVGAIHSDVIKAL